MSLERPFLYNCITRGIRGNSGPGTFPWFIWHLSKMLFCSPDEPVKRDIANQADNHFLSGIIFPDEPGNLIHTYFVE